LAALKEEHPDDTEAGRAAFDGIDVDHISMQFMQNLDDETGIYLEENIEFPIGDLTVALIITLTIVIVIIVIVSVSVVSLRRNAHLVREREIKIENSRKALVMMDDVGVDSNSAKQSDKSSPRRPNSRRETWSSPEFAGDIAIHSC